jgi:hypothetical protein
VAVSAFRRFFDFLAGMGLIVRDDPPKVVDLTAREWGAAVEGLALSIREIPHADPDARAAVSVVLRNVAAAPKSLTVPGWLFFYRFEIRDNGRSGGAPAPMTPFGRELLKPARRTERLEVRLAPGDATETQVPIGSIFNMPDKRRNLVRASCEPFEGVVLQSNEITI